MRWLDSSWSSFYAESDGVRIHYVDTGGSVSDERTVVLAHGFTDCWQTEAPLARALTDEFRCVMFDFRGHGLSDAPREAYGRESLASDVAAVCRATDVKRPILYGASMGVEAVVRAARGADVNPSAFVLSDPPYHYVQSTPDGRATRNREEIRRWNVMCHEAIRAEYEDTHPEYADVLATARVQLRPTVAAICEWAYTPIEELLKSVRGTPTLVFRPDTDVVSYLPEAHGAWADDRDAVDIVNVDGAGHTILRDSYETTVAVIRDFLEKRGV